MTYFIGKKILTRVLKKGVQYKIYFCVLLKTYINFSILKNIITKLTHIKKSNDKTHVLNVVKWKIMGLKLHSYLTNVPTTLI